MYKFSHSPFYFIWNNSQVLCLVNKNVGTCTYVLNRMLPRESIYVPVYMCVFNFFPKTRGPMKPKFMWNHNRIGDDGSGHLLFFIIVSPRGLLAGI